MNAPRIRRRHLWVEPEYQKRFLHQMLLPEMMLMMSISMITLIVAMLTMAPGENASFFRNHILVIYGALVLFIALSLAVIGLCASHLAAGPIFGIERYLKAVREGRDPGRLALRENDPLKGLAESINQTVDYLQSNKAGD